MDVDRRYLRTLADAGLEADFFHFYHVHNEHMLTYAAMMCGRSAVALRHVYASVKALPDEWVRNNTFMDMFVALPLEVLVRFGRWHELLDDAHTPMPPPHLVATRALWHAARGIACAATHDVQRARTEQAAFVAAVALVSPTHPAGNNKARSVLALVAHMLEGEISLRAGDTAHALAELEAAVCCEDNLTYDEPPGWIVPVRHALGAALLQLGRAADAERVYRADLARSPLNGWSLWGLARALRIQAADSRPQLLDEADAVSAQFARVWEHADIALDSSCICLPNV